MKTTTLTLALMSALALAACAETNDGYAATDSPQADDRAMTEPAIGDDATLPPATTPGDDALADVTASAEPGYGDAAGRTTMDPNLDILANASQSGDHTTLVAALEAAELDDELQGDGPYTLFAPTDDAFERLPDGTVDVESGNSEQLADVVGYHIVEGRLDTDELTERIEAGNGQAQLTTLQGETLVAKADGRGGITITDAQGNVATVLTADLRQRNGVVHVVDEVLRQ